MPVRPGKPESLRFGIGTEGRSSRGQRADGAVEFPGSVVEIRAGHGAFERQRGVAWLIVEGRGEVRRGLQFVMEAAHGVEAKFAAIGVQRADR